MYGREPALVLALKRDGTPGRVFPGFREAVRAHSSRTGPSVYYARLREGIQSAALETSSGSSILAGLTLALVTRITDAITTALPAAI